MKLLVRLTLLLLALGALAFRLPVLDNRPMHGDEAVHAFKFRELWEEGTYRYDPNEFHGPTLYYATLPAVWLSGVHHFAETNEGHYRIVTAVFGAALVLLLALVVDGLGWPAALCAGVLLAVSPAFVFYSRYYIQETLLVFFTLAFLSAGWRYAQSRHPGWLLTAGLGAGLMIASKETALLSFGAMAIALWAYRATKGCRLTGWRVPGDAAGLGKRWNGWHVIAAVAVTLLTAGLFLSGFFRNPSGPLDYLRACGVWLSRARETDLHQHPWFYYLQILTYTHRLRGPVWSEALILGWALVGLATALTPLRRRVPEVSPNLLRFLSVYTVALTAAYSLIPYKTPWCLLNFLLGLILLAGVGAVVLVRWASRWWLQGIVGLLLLGGAGHLAWLSYQTSYVFNTDGRNPYVYAQTIPDIIDLRGRMKELARVAPQHDGLVIKVLSVDEYYWPLPWYLRGFPNVGYWTEMPSDPNAPVVIASPQFDRELERRLGLTHQMTGYLGLRPTVVFGIWVQKDLWRAFIESRSRVRPGGGNGGL